ncbi:MAG: prepilin-type N-terminal cleavage/methylation domain-containing protein [Candidatus Levyibacteriota bacterium]
MKKRLSFNNRIFNKKEGFTLIELLIVVAIIGILATLLMSNFVGVRQRGRDAQRKSDMRQLQSALEMYRADEGAYPLVIPACGSSLKSVDETITYMQKIPCDPSNSGSFVYVYASSNGSTYSLIACLENVNDSQKDSPNNPQSRCDGVNAWSYTLLNP